MVGCVRERVVVAGLLPWVLVTLCVGGIERCVRERVVVVALFSLSVETRLEC